MAATEEAVVAEAPAEATAAETKSDAPAADGDAEATQTTPKPRKKKNRRTVTTGQIHVLATFNNTIITVTDPNGNTLATASATRDDAEPDIKEQLIVEYYSR